MKRERQTHLDTIKTSIIKMIELPGNRDCLQDFMSGYNSVYALCTSREEEKYVIEGGEVYQLYDRILLQVLERFPKDYTFEKLVQFIDGYRIANERVSKMLSFLSRYFIRVSLETQNTNIQEIKKLYFCRVFDVIFRGQEDRIYAMAVEETSKYIGMKSEENHPETRRKQSVLRVFFREYLKIVENASQKKPLRKMYGRLARLVVDLKDAPEQQKYFELYRKISAIDTLFKQKEKTKRQLYRTVEEMLSEKMMKGFVETFVGVLFSKGLSKETYSRMCSFYSFVDNSERGKEIFVNTALQMVVDIFGRTHECGPLLKLLSFLGKHLQFMERVKKQMRKPLELVFTRKIREIFAGNATHVFETDLLREIEKHKKNEEAVQELSLFISNVPGYKYDFWHRLRQDAKNRMVLHDTLGFEKKLVRWITRRIEKERERHTRHVLKVHRRVVEYISESTLYDGFPFYDVSNFEEVLLCARDVAISEMHFRNEQPGLSESCKLLAYTRWAYPRIEMQMPWEIEGTWEKVRSYCKEKGRRFVLGLCPDVSSMVLDVNGAEITCDFVQGCILVLLGKTGQKTREEMARAMFTNGAEEYLPFVEQKLESLLAQGIVAENNGLFALTTKELPKEVNVFSPKTEEPVAKKSEAARLCSQSVVEGYIVGVLKSSGKAAREELFRGAHEKYGTTEQEFSVYTESLRERDFLSVSGDTFHYIP